MYYKSKSFRNAKYLSWIRKQNCLVTDMDFTQTDMVAHHVRTDCRGGMGLKPSDFNTIPLTAFQHFLLHQGVEKEYYSRHHLDVGAVMRELLERYLYQKGIAHADLPFDELELLVSVS